MGPTSITAVRPPTGDPRPAWRAASGSTNGSEKSDGYCAFGRTLTWTGRIIAPGPGSPDVMLTVVDCVGAMQKVAARAPLCASVARLPERSMVPPFRVGKHGTLVLVEQHTCEMPPLASMHCPSAVLAMQALPVQAAVQVPAPHASSCVWPTLLQGSGPGALWAVSVVSGRSRSRVPARVFAGGMHSPARR